MKRNEEMSVESSDRETAPNADWTASRRPVTRFSHGADAIEVTIELPGVSAEDVELTSEGRRLAVRARAAAWTHPEGMRSVQTEIQQGGFGVTLELPRGVAAERIKADMRAGLLTLSLPLQEDTRRSIEVAGT